MSNPPGRVFEMESLPAGSDSTVAKDDPEPLSPFQAILRERKDRTVANSHSDCNSGCICKSLAVDVSVPYLYRILIKCQCQVLVSVVEQYVRLTEDPIQIVCQLMMEKNFFKGCWLVTLGVSNISGEIAQLEVGDRGHEDEEFPSRHVAKATNLFWT